MREGAAASLLHSLCAKVDRWPRRSPDDGGIEARMGRLILKLCMSAKREGQRPALVVLRCWAALRVVVSRQFAPLTSTWLTGIRRSHKVIGTLAEIRAYRFVIAHQTLLRPMGG
jgi:hypothetical protein